MVMSNTKENDRTVMKEGFRRGDTCVVRMARAKRKGRHGSMNSPEPSAAPTRHPKIQRAIAHPVDGVWITCTNLVDVATVGWRFLPGSVASAAPQVLASGEIDMGFASGTITFRRFAV